MKIEITLLITLSTLCSSQYFSQSPMWKMDLANQLALMPMKCIQQEYPNKTGHIIMSEEDARLTPSELHPSFYGCLDWHSSVHGHWMLVKILKDFPNLPSKEAIINILENSFEPNKIIAEREYFTKYPLSKTFERTYGWAWLLKLDEELNTWNHPLGAKWAKQLQPLTDQIVSSWKEYLPKQTYANHTGVHPNSAFGLSFAWDWAKAKGDIEFQQQIETKIRDFYQHLSGYKALLEPDGSDFYSNSLYIAEAMTRILPTEEYQAWLSNFLSEADFIHLSQAPFISDRMDYQITHLDGLMFSRAWNLFNISKYLGEKHPQYVFMQERANILLSDALSHLDKGNYGGEHWLASFAVYALTR